MYESAFPLMGKSSGHVRLEAGIIRPLMCAHPQSNELIRILISIFFIYYIEYHSNTYIVIMILFYSFLRPSSFHPPWINFSFIRWPRCFVCIHPRACPSSCSSTRSSTCGLRYTLAQCISRVALST